MYLLNRSTLIVKLKKPYLDWINYVSAPEKFTLESLNIENNVFLIPEFDTKEQLESIIKSAYTEIFEVELQAWYADESTWPEKRDYKTFKQWFDITVHSMLFDTSEEILERDDF